MRRIKVCFRARSLAETIEAIEASANVDLLRKARACFAGAGMCVLYLWAATRQPAGAISAAAGSFTRLQYCTLRSTALNGANFWVNSAHHEVQMRS